MKLGKEVMLNLLNVLSLREEVVRGPGSMLEMAEDTNRKKPTPEDVAEEPNNKLLNCSNLQAYCDIR